MNTDFWIGFIVAWCLINSISSIAVLIMLSRKDFL